MIPTDKPEFKIKKAVDPYPSVGSTAFLLLLCHSVQSLARICLITSPMQSAMRKNPASLGWMLSIDRS